MKNEIKIPSQWKTEQHHGVVRKVMITGKKNAHNKEEGGPSVLKIMTREFQMENDRVQSSLHFT